VNLFVSGGSAPIAAQLEDGEENRYLRAFAYTGGSLEGYVDLNHIGLGHYAGTFNPATANDYHIIYIVFSDAGRTTEDTNYHRSVELWRAINTFSPTVADQVLREALVDHVGYAGSLAEAIDNLHTRLTAARAAALDSISGMTVDITLVKKMLKNKLELAEGSSDNWILYDDDKVTPILKWNVRDKDGQGIRISAYAPARRDPVYP
jgi:hypothetical protein